MKNFGKIISDKDVITKEYLDSKGYISAITSKMVTDALGFTPFDSAAFTKASIKNALGIADWALAASKPSYDDRYLKLSGGTITGSLISEGVTGQDIEMRLTGDRCSLALRIGSGGTSRGLFDVTQNAWWIHRREDGYAIFSGESYYTGNLTAGGGLTLGGVKITSWSNVASYISLPYLSKNAALMPLNTFDNAGNISFSYLSNALYAASSRMSVVLTGFSKTDAAGLFSGSYEQSYDVAAGTTGVVDIVNNSGLFADYPYGDTIISFYYTYTPESVSVQVYDTSKGWQTLTLKERRGTNNGVFVFSNTSHYYVTQMRITVVAPSGHIARLVQIDHFLSRGQLKELPVVTKFGIEQTLYGHMKFANNVTMQSKVKIESAYGHEIEFDGNALKVNAGLYLGGQYSLRLNGELRLNEQGIRNWSDLGTYITPISSETTSEKTISPNTFYKWGSVSALSITLGAATNKTHINNYMFEFTASTGFALGGLSGVKWADGVKPNIKAGYTYQFSIINNCATYSAFKTA